MASQNDYQTKPGRRQPCCISMVWAVWAGYIRRGYLYHKHNPPRWCSWSIKVKDVGFYDVSPIHFCPFCGKSLDVED
jgi:hypothetical protein